MIFVFVINLSELIGFRVFCLSKTFRIVFFQLWSMSGVLFSDIKKPGWCRVAKQLKVCCGWLQWTPEVMDCIVSAYSQNCNEHRKSEELKMSRLAFRCPNVRFAACFHPRPTWERIPCPVRSSVPSPMTKPIIARRPFHCSAKEEKPNFASSMGSNANMSNCDRLLRVVARCVIQF